MIKLLLAFALLVSSLPTDSLSQLPGEAGESVRGHHIDFGFPAERIEAGGERSNFHDAPDRASSTLLPGAAEQRPLVSHLAPDDRRGVEAVTPTCERLPYDATAPPIRG